MSHQDGFNFSQDDNVLPLLNLQPKNSHYCLQKVIDKDERIIQEHLDRARKLAAAYESGQSSVQYQDPILDFDKLNPDGMEP